PFCAQIGGHEGEASDVAAGAGGALCGEHGYSRKWDQRESVSAARSSHMPCAQASIYLVSIAARTRATVSAGGGETCPTSGAPCSPEGGPTSILSLSASAR